MASFDLDAYQNELLTGQANKVKISNSSGSKAGLRPAVTDDIGALIQQKIAERNARQDAPLSPATTAPTQFTAPKGGSAGAQLLMSSLASFGNNLYGNEDRAAQQLVADELKAKDMRSEQRLDDTAILNAAGKGQEMRESQQRMATAQYNATLGKEQLAKTKALDELGISFQGKKDSLIMAELAPFKKKLAAAKAAMQSLSASSYKWEKGKLVPTDTATKVERETIKNGIPDTAGVQDSSVYRTNVNKMYTDMVSAYKALGKPAPMSRLAFQQEMNTSLEGAYQEVPRANASEVASIERQAQLIQKEKQAKDNVINAEANWRIQNNTYGEVKDPDKLKAMTEMSDIDAEVYNNNLAQLDSSMKVMQEGGTDFTTLVTQWAGNAGLTGDKGDNTSNIINPAQSDAKLAIAKFNETHKDRNISINDPLAAQLLLGATKNTQLHGDWTNDPTFENKFGPDENQLYYNMVDALKAYPTLEKALQRKAASKLDAEQSIRDSTRQSMLKFAGLYSK